MTLRKLIGASAIAAAVWTGGCHHDGGSDDRAAASPAGAASDAPADPERDPIMPHKDARHPRPAQR